MPEYLYIGGFKENIMKGTHQANLVICLDCGTTIEITDSGNRGHCSCSNYERVDYKWRKRE